MRSKIGSGIVAGLLAAAVFGVLMHAISVPAGMGGRMPMIRMMASVVRSDRLLAGWAYVLASGAVMGAVFALVLGDRARSMRRALAWGAAYGVLVWLVGALVVMPLLVDMPVFSPITMPAMRPSTWASLGAHIVAGLLLGTTYSALRRG